PRHRTTSTVTCAALASLLLAAAPAAGQTGAAPRPEVPAPAVTVAAIDGPITIDGVWSPGEWDAVPVTPVPYESTPLVNRAAAERTECRVGHDEARLLFSCRAFDSNPAGIRAFLADRDHTGEHDVVGLSLDPAGDARRAFSFSVNAAGVQADSLYDSGSGVDDVSWDAIWESAARRTPDGYIVEAAIPFQSLRFPPPTPDGTWRLYYFRHRPRTTDAWYQSFYQDTGNGCFLCQLSVARAPQGIAGGRNVEVVPTVVARRTRTRQPFPGGPLVDRGTRDLGVSARWGITPDLSLNATLNPDFSQIEADAVQLEANTQFALLVPERRPFFLEGADLFGTPLQALFTRSMADPSSGAKVSGKLGANVVGVMAVRDETTNLLLPGPAGSSTVRLDQPNTALAGRMRRDLGGGASVGALYTGRIGDGYANHVVGADAFVRPFKALDTRFQLLRTWTDYPGAAAGDRALPAGTLAGNAARLEWTFNNQTWQSQGYATYVGDDVRTDLGFTPRVGYAQYEGWARRNWYGSGDAWFSRMDVTAGYEEVFTAGDVAAEQELFGRWAVDGPLQTRFFFNPRYRREAVNGQWFTTPQAWWWFWITPTRHVNLHVRYSHGTAVDYVNERAAGFREALATLAVRLGAGLAVETEFASRRLLDEGATALDATVVQGRVIYSFSTRARLRLTAQYQETARPAATNRAGAVPLRRGALLQALFSYTVNPQTALYLGYGRQGLDDPLETRRRLVTEADGVFIKLGYAWRP
ncbi:MAG: DUF5916 domain-containing protein, partial [Vicinamibacterales bacterium]